jgi:hypothetical protein
MKTLSAIGVLNQDLLPEVIIGVADDWEPLALREAREWIAEGKTAIRDAEDAFLAATPKSEEDAAVKEACRSVWLGKRQKPGR